MSVYGGLVPLGFPHSNQAMAAILFCLLYRILPTGATGFFKLLLYFPPGCDKIPLPSGKQVGFLREPVAVSR